MKGYKTYQYKAYLKKGDHERIDEVLLMCGQLYNAALEERKLAYKMAGKSVSNYEQIVQFTDIRKDIEEWKNLSVHIGRGVLQRVDRSFQGFFRRVKNGEKPGYPRFQPRTRYKTIELDEVTRFNIKRSSDGRRAYIKIKGLPTLTLRTKRPLPEGTPKVIMITKRPVGYVVSMAFEVKSEILPKNNNQVGIDMGVNKRMTLSTGEEVERRNLNRRRENRLRRKVSRAIKGSNNRRKKVVMLSRETYRNQIRNRNTCHEITTDLIKRFDRIAVENLQIKNMLKAHRGLSRSINEQTWGILTEQLAYKAEYAGREFIKVDPKYTSKTCSNCGVILKEKLATYTLFICEECGLVIDRDINAAINIEVRAFGDKSPRIESPERRGDSASHAQLSSLEPVHVELYSL